MARRSPLTTRKKLLLVTLVVLPVLAVFIFSSRGLLKRIGLEQTEKEITTELAQEKETADSLQIEIERLKSDPSAIEKVARERYGMIRKDEQIYTVEEEGLKENE